MNKITEQMKRELARLALLREDEIDTVDIPEEIDWKRGERSRFAVSTKRALQRRDYDIRSIANWFIRHFAAAGKPITNLSLNKIVYFAFERLLIERSVVLSKAKIEAWAHGPVFREIYHSLKDNGDAPILEEIRKFSVKDRRLIPARDELSVSDEEFLEEIARTYGRLNAGQLVALSHRVHEPWAAVWHYRGSTNPGMEISLDLIIHKAPKRRNFDVR